MVLEKVSENALKLSGDVSLSDIYSRFPDCELSVEPLSAKKPLSDFISAGGFGYGSLREGPFNSKIFNIEWKRPKYRIYYEHSRFLKQSGANCCHEKQGATVQPIA